MLPVLVEMLDQPVLLDRLDLPVQQDQAVLKVLEDLLVLLDRLEQRVQPERLLQSLVLLDLLVLRVIKAYQLGTKELLLIQDYFQQ